MSAQRQTDCLVEKIIILIIIVIPNFFSYLHLVMGALSHLLRTDGLNLWQNITSRMLDKVEVFAESRPPHNYWKRWKAHRDEWIIFEKYPYSLLYEEAEIDMSTLFRKIAPLLLPFSHSTGLQCCSCWAAKKALSLQLLTGRQKGKADWRTHLSECSGDCHLTMRCYGMKGLLLGIPSIFFFYLFDSSR